ncbi:MAG: hypothetical protein HN919_07465 [Verrucomicrobia bacterium]|jgi:hypothetical protein|nr:hypothetical protein [Verrucomicrobiota bacterium]MBT7066125.1 hypothetical protein [Verrucomicrobiota bacterium]MBT7700754.1 hypothetical protein [Verrucomicrobiota bacterium]
MDVDQLEASVEKLHEVFDCTDIEMEWKKVEQKLNEAKYSPGSVRPLADSIFSLLLAARSEGYKVKAVLAELDKVAADNLAHRWKRMADGTYQHVD